MTGVPEPVAGVSGRPVSGGPPGATAVRRVSLWNVANLLTMVRLLLVPGFIALMLAGGGYDPAWRSLAWAAFTVAMITDLFDGHVARTYGLVTDFGKIADPIADKAIMGTALVCLSALGDLPWWVTGIILGRELGITLLRFWVIRFGVIPASRGGKLKTLAQGTAVGMYVLALTGPLATLRFWVMAVAVVLTVVSGLDYVKQAVVLRRQGRRRERERATAPTGPPAGPPAPTGPLTGREAPSTADAGAGQEPAPVRDGVPTAEVGAEATEVGAGQRHGQEHGR